MLSLTFYDNFHIDCFYVLSHAFSTVEESHDTSIDLIYSIKCWTRDASAVINDIGLWNEILIFKDFSVV